MKLQSLRIKNFGRIVDAEYTLDGKNSTFTGANGTGKTTVKKAFMWGLDCLTVKAPQIRPHDKDRVPLKGLVLSVEITILKDDGKQIVLKKENCEDLKKGQVVGFPNSCSINGVPKGVTEYKKYISEFMPDNPLVKRDQILKMLTSLPFFNTELHWKQRRGVLLAKCGEIKKPSGFIELDVAMDELSITDIDDYQTVLKLRLNGNKTTKGYKKEQAECDTRIDENTGKLTDFDETGQADLITDRDKIKSEIEVLGNARKDVVTEEQERQENVDELNRLKGNKIAREAVLANDTSGVKKFIDEKASVSNAINDITTSISTIQNTITNHRNINKTNQSSLESAIARKNGILEEETALNALKAQSNKCPKCDHVWEISDESKVNQLKELDRRGFAEFNVIKTIKGNIGITEDQISRFTETLDQEKIRLAEAEQQKTERFAILDKQIKSNVTVPPAEDPDWIKISNQITQLEKEIGEPVSQQITEIDTKISTKNEELTTINTELAQFDTAKAVRARIAELSTEETELGQKIAEVEGTLKTIEKYKTAQNNIISEKVNSMFKYVTFRMFKENIGDDGVQDDCTAIYRTSGATYPAASTGEKILMDIDINNVMSEFFGVEVPIFIDNRESLTFPIESSTQIIGLVADKNVPELAFTKD